MRGLQQMDVVHAATSTSLQVQLFLSGHKKAKKVPPCAPLRASSSPGAGVRSAPCAHSAVSTWNGRLSTRSNSDEWYSLDRILEKRKYSRVARATQFVLTVRRTPLRPIVLCISSCTTQSRRVVASVSCLDCCKVKHTLGNRNCISTLFISNHEFKIEREITNKCSQENYKRREHRSLPSVHNYRLMPMAKKTVELFNKENYRPPFLLLVYCFDHF